MPHDNHFATDNTYANLTVNQTLIYGDVSLDHHAATKWYVDKEIENLISGAPSTLDTLREIVDFIGDESTAIDIVARLAHAESSREEISRELHSEISNVIGRIDDVSGELFTEISKVENRLDSLSAELSNTAHDLRTEIDQVSSALSTEVGELEGKISQLSTDVAVQIDDEVDKLETALSTGLAGKLDDGRVSQIESTTINEYTVDVPIGVTFETDKLSTDITNDVKLLLAPGVTLTENINNSWKINESGKVQSLTNISGDLLNQIGTFQGKIILVQTVKSSTEYDIKILMSRQYDLVSDAQTLFSENYTSSDGNIPSGYLLNFNINDYIWSEENVTVNVTHDTQSTNNLSVTLYMTVTHLHVHTWDLTLQDFKNYWNDTNDPKTLPIFESNWETLFLTENENTNSITLSLQVPYIIQNSISINNGEWNIKSITSSTYTKTITDTDSTYTVEQLQQESSEDFNNLSKDSIINIDPYFVGNQNGVNDFLSYFTIPTIMATDVDVSTSSSSTETITTVERYRKMSPSKGGHFQVDETDAYLYIGNHWRIAANNNFENDGKKRLVFEYNQYDPSTDDYNDPLSWIVGVPFIQN